MEFTSANTTTAGNKGEGIRSDCFITMELADSGGIQLELKSKVESMFGESIRALVHEVLDFFGVQNARILLEDSGALPHVLAARLEAAVKVLISTDKEFLLPMLPENGYSTNADRSRISRLYLPGNTPNLAINAGIHKPDAIILDLEDSVAPARKSEARFLIRNALRNIDFYGAERMVRINQLPEGLSDLAFIVPHNVNLVLIPKCEGAEQVKLVNEEIQRLKKAAGITTNIWLMPIVESALGVMKAFEIAQCENVVAMAIGLEDYTADLGVKRTVEGMESLFARSMIVNACKAAGIQPIDSVFSDVGDMEGLQQNALRSKALGFEGMGCIHPRQIRVIHDAFAPDDEEIDKAKKIVIAYMEAEEKGLGVVSLGTKMIDAPVVKRARKVIEQAVKHGKLDADWNNQNK
jgi:citrate lyase subunit beta / citryl-CoA lyase